MEQGKRSTKQTVLLVVSIVIIVFASLCLIGGVIVAAGSLVIAGGGTEGVSTEAGTLASGEVGVLAGVMGIALVVVGAFSLVMGILGVRGANNAYNVTPFFVMAILSAIIEVVGLFLAVTPGGIALLVVDVFCAWLGYSVRKESLE